MIVKETTNLDDIKAVLCNPAIYDCITTDRCPSAKDFEPPIDDSYLYVGGYVGGEIVAIMVYHEFRDGTKLHIQILPEFRNKYAIEFGGRALLFRGNKPLYAVISDLYPNVLEYAKSFGFDVIERLDSGETKRGEPFIDNVLKYNRD
jgi:hypothetical protein